MNLIRLQLDDFYRVPCTLTGVIKPSHRGLMESNIIYGPTPPLWLNQEISLFGPPKTSKTKNQAGDTLTSLILFAHLWNHVALWTWSSTHFGPRSDTWRRSGPGRTSPTTWGRTTPNSEHNLTFRDRSSSINLFVSVTDLLSN